MEKRISDKIHELLNTQIANELNSSRLYLAISQWADYNGYFGIAKLYRKYSEEELVHMNKIYSYLQDRNALPAVPATKMYATNFKDVQFVVNETFVHEKEVSGNWKDIWLAAMVEKDGHTFDLAMWFLHEQTEEEAKAINLNDKLERCGLDKIGIQLFDEFCEEQAG